MTYEILLYTFVGSAALALSTAAIQLITLARLYNISKRNHLSIAGRYYDSLGQLDKDLALGCRLWRNPDLVRLADPHQRQYLAGIRRLSMAGLVAWVTFFLMLALVLIFIVTAVGG